MMHTRTQGVPTDAAARCLFCGRTRITAWLLQIVAALILTQTLFFKFSGAPEAVYIFSKLGVEPWGRLLAGVCELLAAALLLWPRMSILGAAMSVGIMVGAIGSHLGPLGIVVRDDGGLLFGLAIVVLLCGLGVLVLRRDQVRSLLGRPLGYLRG